MNNRIYSLGEVARLLAVPQHRVTYQHSTGRVPEPQKLCGRRAYRWADVVALADRLGVAVEERRGDG